MHDVDIIMATYNPGSYILEAIESCLNQSYNSIQLTVVNDCSTYDISFIQNKYPKINFLNMDINSGPAAARNFGIKNTKAKYISFLDDDDVMSRDKIHYSLEEFAKDSSLGMVCGNYQRIIDGKLQKPFYPNEVIVNYQNLMKINLIASGSVTMRRDLIASVGYFNEKYKIAEDYDYWLRIIEAAPVKYIHKVLYYYRVNNDGRSITQKENSKQKEAAALYEIRESSRKRIQGK